MQNHQSGSVEFFVLAAIALFAGIGIAVALYTKQDDGPVEEAAEHVIEELVEEELGIPDHALDGKIDLTPSSKE